MASKKKKTVFTKFDAVEYLKTADDVAGFLSASIEEAHGDETIILHALNTALRAQKRNVAELSRVAGITRSGLYEILAGKRNPSFATMLHLLEAMDLTVSVTAIK